MWSGAKTRLSWLVAVTQVTFRRSVVRGHSNSARNRALSFNNAVWSASKNMPVSSRGLRSSDISQSCDLGTFDGGATRRAIGAVLPACKARRYYKHSSCVYMPVATAEKSFRRIQTYDNIYTVTCYHLMYVPRATEGSLDAITC